MDKKLKIAVVVVVYNGRKYLSDCFYSLKKQTLSPEEVICVDNNSQDDSAGYIRKKYPEFNLIVNKKNQGFAGANNQGIEMALQNNPDYIFLLNQDAVCQKHCLERLAEQAEKEKENVFAWQPLILCWPEKDRIQTAGDKIHFLGFGYCGDYKKPADKETIEKLERDLTYASGAAMFINIPALRKVGFLDKDLFLYHEDLDLCLRARFLGYEIKLTPEAIIYHKYTEGIPKHRWYWSERNRLLTLLKFYKLPTLVMIFPAWLLMEFGVLGFSLMTGWFHLKLKSYFTCLVQVPRTLIKRRKIQRRRKISDRELSRYLESEFNFTGFSNPLLKNVVNPVLKTYWNFVRKIIFW